MSECDSVEKSTESNSSARESQSEHDGVPQRARLPLNRKRQGKSTSLYGKNPDSKLGPKAALSQGATLLVQDPSAQKLQWCKTPLTALVIRKPGDFNINQPYKRAIELLVERHLRVFVEEGTVDSLCLPEHCKPKLTFFNSEKDTLTDKIDFIVTLGGDGTLIHASSLFQGSVPPILAFNLGSLGFLTPFDVESMPEAIDKALAGEVGLTLRSRLKCVISTKDYSDQLHDIKSLENGFFRKSDSQASYSVVNEVVIDRGPHPYLCHIDLYVDRRYVTSVQGDGIIISTPTGSTAYAAAAGASMMHPSVPAILIVPVCAHSLSFRPIVLPAGVEIMIKVAADARNTAWAAFDGRNRTELKHGDSLRIITSIYPLPSLSKLGQLEDWFSSLADCLHWNVRKPQKALHKSEMSETSSSAVSLSSLTMDEASLSP
ncbi:NAD kinase-like [Watersipora subatra]|uniref:NAD kinase-like n=1 Tax=Watersipora subatra TaxID=2589382 RepID=UPI00355C785F